MENMHKLAESFGGKCLSIIYKNDKTKLIWKCKKEEHEPFSRAPRFAKGNSWCTKCMYETKREEKLKKANN